MVTRNIGMDHIANSCLNQFRSLKRMRNPHADVWYDLACAAGYLALYGRERLALGDGWWRA